MNMFSTIEIVKGYATKDANVAAKIMYDRAETIYNNAYNKWRAAVAQYGETSNEANDLYTDVVNALDNMTIA
jgi:hypothetical protein